MRYWGILILTGACFAQAPYDHLGAVGVSYQPGGTAAGTGMYSQRLAASSGAYAFTVADAVPQLKNKPYTVNNSFSAGIAQKLVTLKVGKLAVPLFIPTSAGISYSGASTGWAWSTGGMAVVPLGKSTAWYLLPVVRVIKSSVNNNAGYGAVAGVLIGWGW